MTEDELTGEKMSDPMWWLLVSAVATFVMGLIVWGVILAVNML